MSELDFKVIRRDEDVRTEFKIEIRNDDEFLETVVAFANTTGR